MTAMLSMSSSKRIALNAGFSSPSYSNLLKVIWNVLTASLLRRLPVTDFAKSVGTKSSKGNKHSCQTSGVVSKD